MVDQRKFSRVPFEAETELRIGDAGYRVALIDISLKGALVGRPEGWNHDPPAPGELRLHLTGSDVVIFMRTEVVYEKEGRLGLSCTSIDLDSIAHLRRLMELNLGDPALVERELTALF